MSYRNALKAGRSLLIQPGNVQRVRMRVAFHGLQSLQVLSIVISNFAVNQSRMRQD